MAPNSIKVTEIGTGAGRLDPGAQRCVLKDDVG